MKPITRGRGKNKGYWVWEAENPPAIYRTPIRSLEKGQKGEYTDPARDILNRRRVREMKGE